MTDVNKVRELAKFVFDGVMVDADVRNFVKEKIYPKQMELGELNLKLLGEVIHALVWGLNYTVWFELSEDLVNQYNTKTGAIKINSNNCKGAGFNDVCDKFLVDISLNGRPTLIELPLSIFERTSVELEGTNSRLRVTDILQGVISGLIVEFSSDRGNVTLSEMMESVEDNVVKVDFKKKTRH